MKRVDSEVLGMVYDQIPSATARHATLEAIALSCGWRSREAMREAVLRLRASASGVAVADLLREDRERAATAQLAAEVFRNG